MYGALSSAWRWSQAAPFLDNMEEALPHLKRWMPPATLERLIERTVTPMQEVRRLHAQSDRYELDSCRVPPAPTPPAAVAKCRAWCRELPAAPLSGSAPKVGLLRRACAACGKQQLQMLQCSRCKAAFDCGAACQKRHWREHKAACGAAAAAAGT